MELEGIVHIGVIVPDDVSGLSEGARVRFEVLADAGVEPDDLRDFTPPQIAETREEFLASLRESIAAAKSGDLGMTVDEAFAKLEAEFRTA